MRFLHCADIHLGRRPTGPATSDFSRKRYEDYFSAFARIVNLAISEKVDAVLIAGDLFERRELIPDVVERAEHLLQQLHNENIEIIVIEGNHDNFTPGNEAESWLMYFSNKELLKRPYYYFKDNSYHFVPIGYKDINFYGLGYPGAMAAETISAFAEFLNSQPKEKNVVLIHTAISDGLGFHDSVPKTAIDLLNNKVIYAAGGHFHYHSKYPASKPFFFIPGSPEYWDWGEIGQKKGVIIFDTDTEDYRFIQLEQRHSIKLQIKLKASDSSTFATEFDDFISSLDIIPGETIVIMELWQNSNFFVDLTACEAMLMRKGALKSYIYLFNNSSVFHDFTNPTLGVEQIERDLISGWKSFGKDVETAITSLNKLKDYQRENEEDRFIETFDSLLEQIIGIRETEIED
ncbi:MAG: putative metallophosphatase [Ignavibacteria bacterium]|nr:putative metallophosphatase [Ignavibacteria bacterium]